MKRAHQSAHRLMWFVLAPAMAVVLWLSVTHRPVPPSNDALPSSILTETADLSGEVGN